jgi:hypothetical protein
VIVALRFKMTVELNNLSSSRSAANTKLRAFTLRKKIACRYPMPARRFEV